MFDLTSRLLSVSLSLSRLFITFAGIFHFLLSLDQQSTGGAATPTLQRNFSSSSSAASPAGPSAGVELPSPSNSSNGSAEHPTPTVQRSTVVDGGQRSTQIAVVTVADSMAPSSCCFASSSSATITTTTTRSMQLANDELPAVVEDTGRNTVTGGIESHGIRVLTPSEIMRTLPSIGNAANNSVHHVHHPNVPSGSCPSPAPLQQQNHHHLHHHQQHHQYLHQHHPVALQQHLQQQQQQQQLHHHHPAVNATVHFVGLKYRPDNSCGMRICGMDSLDQFGWILFIFFSLYRSPLLLFLS